MLTWFWSLFDVGHVSNRHLVSPHLLAFCSFWLVSSVSNLSRIDTSLLWLTLLWLTWLSGVVHVWYSMDGERGIPLLSLLVRPPTWLASQTRRRGLATRASLICPLGAAHVANVLHVAREPGTSPVSSDTCIAHLPSRGDSRVEKKG